MGRFKGIAYWNVQTGQDDWLAKSSSMLAPITTGQFGKVEHLTHPMGGELLITLQGEPFRIPVYGGKGQGLVRDSGAAALFILVLLAISKRVGDISIVTDDDKVMPARITPAHPILGKNWSGVEPLALALDLKVGDAFKKSYPGIFRRF
ncbi:MAG: hypothetical protein KGZ68_16785 [Dechloromonas sp.]|nr:hypothetical protein [Dechloromonas sp.]